MINYTEEELKNYLENPNTDPDIVSLFKLFDTIFKEKDRRYELCVTNCIYFYNKGYIDCTEEDLLAVLKNPNNNWVCTNVGMKSIIYPPYLISTAEYTAEIPHYSTIIDINNVPDDAKDITVLKADNEKYCCLYNFTSREEFTKCAPKCTKVKVIRHLSSDFIEIHLGSEIDISDVYIEPSKEIEEAVSTKTEEKIDNVAKNVRIYTGFTKKEAVELGFTKVSGSCNIG